MFGFSNLLDNEIRLASDTSSSRQTLICSESRDFGRTLTWLIFCSLNSYRDVMHFGHERRNVDDLRTLIGDLHDAQIINGHTIDTDRKDALILLPLVFVNGWWI